MVLIRINDGKAEQRAIGVLAGRFTFKTWINGDIMVPEGALAFLAREGVSFTVQGLARYKQSVPTVRDPVAASIQ